MRLFIPERRDFQCLFITSVTELIGRTPLLELCNYERNHDLKAVLLAKLECMNPAAAPRTGWLPT